MKNKGFTLVELLVVIGIFFIISTVVLIDTRNPRERLGSDLAAHEVSLIIREAQIYGAATRDQYDGFGVCFTRGDNEFTLHGWEEGDDGNVCGDDNPEKTYQLSDYEISDLGEGRDSLGVFFERGRTRADFKDENGQPLDDDDIITITVSRPGEGGSERHVVVSRNGQIRTERPDSNY